MRTALDFDLLTVFVVIVLGLSTARSRRPPNIIVVVADDLGYNDVGYHGSEIYTPNLDKLARTGVMLENYYVAPSCTPSRSQLLTGRYGIHTGQIRNIAPLQPTCLSLDEVTIAEKLKAKNYRTHMVGKWHLGFSRIECTPTHRGFDSFYGILLGSGDHFRYFKRENAKRYGSHYGYDLWRNNTVSREEGRLGIYSTTLYRNEALKIVSNHDPKDPLFMYLAFQAPHGPLQVPKYWLTRNNGITHLKRRHFAGMVTALDSAVGDLVRALKSRDLWQNTVLVFTTDNGGQIVHGGSNWPLRGGKGSLWEGGVRGVGFVNSPLIKRPGWKNHRLMHVSDWFPTFVRLAHGHLNGTKPLDGFDQWDTISRNTRSLRKDVLLGSVTGVLKQSINELRFQPECRQFIPKRKPTCKKKKAFKFSTMCLVKKAAKCLTYNGLKWCHRTAIRQGKWKLLVGVQKLGNWIAPRRSGFKTECSSPYAHERRLQLFNVKRDPYEKKDVAWWYPKVVRRLMAKLERYRRTSVPESWLPYDLRGSPHYNGGVWRPWMSSDVTMA